VLVVYLLLNFVRPNMFKRGWGIPVWWGRRWGILFEELSHGSSAGCGTLLMCVVDPKHSLSVVELKKV
jgi:hypothetical protein